MMRMFSPNSPFGKWMSFLLDGFFICVVWAVFSLPVFTAGAATAAVYHIAVCWVRDGEEGGVRAFVAAFRENFPKATCIWLVLLLPLVLILANGYLIWISSFPMPAAAKIVFYITAFLWAITAEYVFALQATFENSVFSTIGNALRLALSHLFPTLIMLVIHGIALFLTLLFPPAYVILLPAAMFLSGRLCWSVFSKVAA